MCFVIMPFKTELQAVFDDYVKPAVEAHGLDCQRGDNAFGSNVIMDDILTAIRAADVVIADLTEWNPNVCYEVGIAHTLGKQVLLMAQSIDDIPFDLRHRRVLVYEDSLRGSKPLRENLRAHIQDLVGMPSRAPSAGGKPQKRRKR